MNEEEQSNFVVNEITLAKMQIALNDLGYDGLDNPEHIYVPEIKVMVEQYQEIHEKQSAIVNGSRHEIGYIRNPEMGGRYPEVMEILTRSEAVTYVFNHQEIDKVIQKLQALQEPALEPLISFCKKANGNLIYFEP